MRDEPGGLEATVTTLRLMAGWAGVSLAALNLSMGADSAGYLVFHVVVLIAGLVLAGWGRLPVRAGRLAVAAGALVAVAGPPVSALPATSTVCCLREFPERHGFPFTVLARGAGGWHPAGGGMAADVLFWVCAGFLVMVVIAVARPARTPSAAADPPPPQAAASTHAEQRNAGLPAAEDENVRGLP